MQPKQIEHEYSEHVDTITAWFIERSGGLQAQAALAELGKRFRSLALGLPDLPSDVPIGRRERLTRVSRLLARTAALPLSQYGMPDLVLLRALLANTYDEMPDDDVVAQRAACMWLSETARLAVFHTVSAMQPPEPSSPGLDTDPVPVSQIAPQVVLRWLVIASGDPHWDRNLDEALLSAARFGTVVEQPLRAFFAQVPGVLSPDLV